METENLISIIQFCDHHNIEHTFIHNLNEHDLIELIMVNGDLYIHSDSVVKIEKMIRLHFELSINLEGIDVIVRLLDKVEALNEELEYTKNRLKSLVDLTTHFEG